MTLFYVPQYFTTTLSKAGGLNNSDTAGIVMADISDLDAAKPGIALLTYADPLDVTKAEWITFTSINGSTKELQGVVRGAEGSTAKGHDNGCAVAFPVSKSHINNLNEIAKCKITNTTASAASHTPNIDLYGVYIVTAQAEAVTFADPSGTPYSGQTLIIRIKDNGTARAITWGSSYRASSDLALPTTTVLSKTLYCGFIWNAADSKWDLLALLNNI